MLTVDLQESFKRPTFVNSVNGLQTLEVNLFARSYLLLSDNSFSVGSSFIFLLLRQFTW